jgi:hypothetical protein
MGTKERNFQPLPEDISLEDLVPEENFFRRLQHKLDLSTDNARTAILGPSHEQQEAPPHHLQGESRHARGVRTKPHKLYPSIEP